MVNSTNSIDYCLPRQETAEHIQKYNKQWLTMAQISSDS